MNAEKPTDNGLELDKIDVGGPPPRQSSRKAPQSNGDQPPLPTTAPSVGWRRPSLLLIAAVAMVGFTAFFLQQKTFFFNFLTGGGGNTHEEYLRVGPLTASLAQKELVRLTIDIDCNSKRLKEKIATADARLRNRIVAVLADPAVESLYRKRNFKAIKARIRSEIRAELRPELADARKDIGPIYIAELLLY